MIRMLFLGIGQCITRTSLLPDTASPPVSIYMPNGSVTVRLWAYSVICAGSTVVPSTLSLNDRVSNPELMSSSSCGLNWVLCKITESSFSKTDVCWSLVLDKEWVKPQSSFISDCEQDNKLCIPVPTGYISESSQVVRGTTTTTGMESDEFRKQKCSRH